MSQTHPDGYIDPNWPNPMGSGDAPIIIYGYTPSFPLALFASIIFFLSLVLHTYQIVRYRTLYLLTIPIALLLEILGYAIRCLSARKDPYLVIWFVLQYFFIVTAPVFLSAAIYAVFSVLIKRVGKEYSLLSPKLVLVIFVSSDAVMTVIQIVGAALIGAAESKNEDPNTGRLILMVGLAIQVASFFVFLILLGDFLRRSKKVLWNGHGEMGGKRGFIVVFVTATLLVYLRTCFRLAEVSEGVTSYLFTHEAFFACLEFAPIAGAMFLFNIWHPGRCLNVDVAEVGRRRGFRRSKA